MSGNKGILGLFKAWVFGLMMVCGTAYAQTDAGNYDPVSADLGDKLFDAGIILCILILVALVSIQFWDSRDKDKK